MAVTKRKLILAYWDCEYCGTEKIKGNIPNCPNCGKPRDDNTRFYIDPTHKEYVPKETAKKINRNPDWICNHCGQLNSDDITTCTWCGSIRDNTNFDYHSNIAKQEKEAQEKKQEFNSECISRHNVLLPVKQLLIAFLALAIIGGLVFLLMPKEYSGTVKAFAWERNILIERYQTVQESSWSLPTNARLKYTHEEFYTTTQVLDHYETKTRKVPYQELVGYHDVTVGYEDLGNGYFEEIISSEPVYETKYTTEQYEEPVYMSVPIYKTKYYYDIDKWLYERTVSTSGNDHEPYWGKINLKSDERVSSKNQTYSITIETSKDTKTFTMSYDDWCSLELNDIVKFQVFLGNAKIIQE